MVRQWLAGRRTLLVLYNAEQVADLAPELLAILARAPVCSCWSRAGEHGTEPRT